MVIAKCTFKILYLENNTEMEMGNDEKLGRKIWTCPRGLGTRGFLDDDDDDDDDIHLISRMDPFKQYARSA